jgi:hypothetical protein
MQRHQLCANEAWHDHLTSGGHTRIANIDVTCVLSAPHTPAPTPQLLMRPKWQRCGSLMHHAKTSIWAKEEGQDQLTSGGHTCVADTDVTCNLYTPYTPSTQAHLLMRPQWQRCSSFVRHAKMSVVCRRIVAGSVDIRGARLNCN